MNYTLILTWIDTPPEIFIETIRRINADILAMSALLTLALDSVKEPIKLLEKENLRNKIKIIVEGVASTEDLAKNWVRLSRQESLRRSKNLSDS